MRILVTGGAGFIGTNLIKKLLKLDYEVYSIDNYSTGKKENEVEGCYYFNKDINFLKFKDSLFKYTDLVIHLAAIARIQPSFKRPEDYINTNFNGTFKIVKCCSEYKIPLIYAGSSSHHSGRFKNPYTFSKDLGEDIIKLYQDHFNLEASIARFYNVYGPHQLTEGGYTTLIGRWIHNMNKGLPCVIYGDGSKRRDFTHVEDIVNGLVKIIDKEAYGYTFEFGKGKNHSINDIAEMFDIKPIYKNNKPGEAQETLADYTFAKEILEWEPKINLKDYINSIK